MMSQVYRYHKKDDPILGLAFYLHPESPKSVNQRSELFAYISKKGDNPTLRVKLQYRAEDWLFIKNYVVHIDGKNHEFDVPDIETLVVEGGICEWVDAVANDKAIEMLRALVKSNKGLLRCVGDQFRKDRDLEGEEVERIASVLEAFDAMKAK